MCMRARARVYVFMWPSAIRIDLNLYEYQSVNLLRRNPIARLIVERVSLARIDPSL